MSAMPVYEYQCQACERVTEARQRMADAPLSDCPHCGANELRRILSVVTVGATASGMAAQSCERSAEPSCFTCGKAGTGCG
jgi:putative FmdB family regulatory protein